MIASTVFSSDRRLLRPLLLALVVLSPALATAQDRGGVDIYEEQLRVRLDEQRPQTREVGWEAGGWFNFALFSYNDAAARKERTLRQFQLRAWAAVNVKGVHRAYVRGILDWGDWNSGDNPINGRGDTFDGGIERAWYQIDFGQMRMNETGERPEVGLRVKVGRDFTTIGTALVLSLPLDLVQFDITTREWEFMIFLAKSVRDTLNLDDSDQVARHQDRCFFGAQATYLGLDHHRPFVYYLRNQDHTDPSSFDAVQSYDYSSSYVGIGSTGTMILPNLRYETELVGEWGRTYSENVRDGGRDRICAWAFDFGLEYFMYAPLSPKLTAEYIFGSGDGDRRVSSTSTVGGNRAGTKDNAFNAFGFRDTGIALAPSISNIHVWTVGASFFPLENVHELFRKMEVGTKVFFYAKHRSGGPTSDPTVSDDSRWLGWEWDVFCDWRLTSDLAWTIRYGIFQPGAAYSSAGAAHTSRHLLYTGVIFSF